MTQKVDIKTVREIAQKHPNFWHRFVSHAKMDWSGNHFEIECGNLDKIEKEYGLKIDGDNQVDYQPNKFFPPAITHQPKQIESVPHDRWPAWVLALEKLKKAGDRGIGDVVARIAGTFGGELFKKWYEKTFKKSCGCTECQADWNAKYPF